MNNLQIFKNKQFGEIRTLMVDNKPYFIGKDVAEKLGYKDTDQAVRNHCKNAITIPVNSTGQVRNVKAIPEGDLYRLIIKSQLQKAQEFESWVMDEVLPSIRQNGMYAVDELLDNPDLLIKTATRLKEEREARLLAEAELKMSQEKLEAAQEDVNAINKISASIGDLDMSETAKRLGIGRNRLYSILRQRGSLYISNEPRQAYINAGYFKYKTYSHNGRLCSTLLVTPKGFAWMLKGLQKLNII